MMAIRLRWIFLLVTLFSLHAYCRCSAQLPALSRLRAEVTDLASFCTFWRKVPDRSSSPLADVPVSQIDRVCHCVYKTPSLAPHARKTRTAHIKPSKVTHCSPSDTNVIALHQGLAHPKHFCDYWRHSPHKRVNSPFTNLGAAQISSVCQCARTSSILAPTSTQTLSSHRQTQVTSKKYASKSSTKLSSSNKPTRSSSKLSTSAAGAVSKSASGPVSAIQPAPVTAALPSPSTTAQTFRSITSQSSASLAKQTDERTSISSVNSGVVSDAVEVNVGRKTVSTSPSDFGTALAVSSDSTVTEDALPPPITVQASQPLSTSSFAQVGAPSSIDGTSTYSLALSSAVMQIFSSDAPVFAVSTSLLDSPQQSAVPSTSSIPSMQPASTAGATTAAPVTGNATPTTLLPYIPSTVDMLDIQRLMPLATATMYFGNPPADLSNNASASDTNGTAQIDVSMQFQYPAVVLDHSSYVTGVDCSSNRTIITFNNATALELARQQWADGVTLLASGTGCDQQLPGGASSRKRGLATSDPSYAALMSQPDPFTMLDNALAMAEAQWNPAPAVTTKITAGIRQPWSLYGKNMDELVGADSDVDLNSWGSAHSPWGYQRFLFGYSLPSIAISQVVNGGRTLGFFKSLLAYIRPSLADTGPDGLVDETNVFSIWCVSCGTSGGWYYRGFVEWDSVTNLVDYTFDIYDNMDRDRFTPGATISSNMGVGFNALLPYSGIINTTILSYPMLGGFSVPGLMTLAPFIQMDLEATINATNIGQLIVSENKVFHPQKDDTPDDGTMLSTVNGPYLSDFQKIELTAGPPTIWGDLNLAGAMKMALTQTIGFSATMQGVNSVAKMISRSEFAINAVNQCDAVPTKCRGVLSASRSGYDAFQVDSSSATTMASSAATTFPLSTYGVTFAVTASPSPSTSVSSFSARTSSSFKTSSRGGSFALASSRLSSSLTSAAQVLPSSTVSQISKLQASASGSTASSRWSSSTASRPVMNSYSGSLSTMVQAADASSGALVSSTIRSLSSSSTTSVRSDLFPNLATNPSSVDYIATSPATASSSSVGSSSSRPFQSLSSAAPDEPTQTSTPTNPTGGPQTALDSSTLAVIASTSLASPSTRLIASSSVPSQSPFRALDELDRASTATTSLVVTHAGPDSSSLTVLASTPSITPITTSLILGHPGSSIPSQSSTFEPNEPSKTSILLPSSSPNAPLAAPGSSTPVVLASTSSILPMAHSSGRSELPQSSSSSRQQKISSTDLKQSGASSASGTVTAGWTTSMSTTTMNGLYDLYLSTTVTSSTASLTDDMSRSVASSTLVSAATKVTDSVQSSTATTVSSTSTSTLASSSMSTLSATSLQEYMAYYSLGSTYSTSSSTCTTPDSFNSAYWTSFYGGTSTLIQVPVPTDTRSILVIGDAYETSLYGGSTTMTQGTVTIDMYGAGSTTSATAASTNGISASQPTSGCEADDWGFLWTWSTNLDYTRGDTLTSGENPSSLTACMDLCDEEYWFASIPCPAVVYDPSSGNCWIVTDTTSTGTLTSGLISGIRGTATSCTPAPPPVAPTQAAGCTQDSYATWYIASDSVGYSSAPVDTMLATTVAQCYNLCTVYRLQGGSCSAIVFDSDQNICAFISDTSTTDTLSSVSTVSAMLDSTGACTYGGSDVATLSANCQTDPWGNNFITSTSTRFLDTLTTTTTAGSLAECYNYCTATVLLRATSCTAVVWDSSSLSCQLVDDSSSYDQGLASTAQSAMLDTTNACQIAEGLTPSANTVTPTGNVKCLKYGGAWYILSKLVNFPVWNDNYILSGYDVSDVTNCYSSCQTANFYRAGACLGAVWYPYSIFAGYNCHFTTSYTVTTAQTGGGVSMIPDVFGVCPFSDQLVATCLYDEQPDCDAQDLDPNNSNGIFGQKA